MEKAKSANFAKQNVMRAIMELSVRCESFTAMEQKGQRETRILLLGDVYVLHLFRNGFVCAEG